ncbi:MAG: S8 family serine peptidase [Acidobacteria bacterium]|nr:S8 family serine peptidase [Acidobacteriota bacterium]
MADEVAVIAKVNSAAEWEALSEVKTGAVMPREEGADFDIVTGRIPISRVEAVRAQPFVQSLKAARRLRPSLDATVPEIGADQLPAGGAAGGGKGAIVGIVDFGGDFAHRNFRKNDGTTRMLAIWDQNGSVSVGSPFGFGRVFRTAEINAALATADPYGTLGYAPSTNPQGDHGTHVMDIAAGNGNGSGQRGVAPNADLIFVEVAATDVPFSGPQAVGKNFGDSVQLLEALQFIFNEAGARPCAINVSLGTNGGPHDGSTLVETGIDRLLAAAPNRAVCIAASNSFSDGIHAQGNVPAGGRADLIWRIGPDDVTGNELDLWYAGADRLAVELIAPDGTSVVRVEPGQTRTLTSNGQLVALVANRLDDPNNHDNNIGVFLESSLPAGDWTLRLHGVTVTNGAFHAWIERDDAGQSTFAPPNDNSMTIGSISCGRNTIVVGSYDAHKAAKPISFFSSSGPTRDGRQKPEISAPGHNVMAARSRSVTGITRMSGTSMASPAVTGTAALVLAQALAAGRSLSIGEIRDALTGTARKNPPNGLPVWDPRYGFGRISAVAAVNQAAAVPPTAAAAPLGPGRSGNGKKKGVAAGGRRGS